MRVSLLAATLIGFCASVAAADGVIDTSFGAADGLGRTGITDAGGNGGHGPVVQSDGKILICDTRTMDGGSGSDFFVARFNANGTLDTSFSFDGKVTIDFDSGTGGDFCEAIALQSDGKIVVAGFTYGADHNQDFAIARLNTDGTLDTNGFGAGTGKTTIAFDLGGNKNDRATAIAIQPDGKIVVAGTVQTASSGTDFGIVRLDTDGTRDGAFNSTGKVTIGFDLPNSNEIDVASAVAIDGQGNIVVGGNASKNTTFTGNDFAVARLLPNGQLDSNFDADGRTTVAFDLGGAGGSNDDIVLGMTLLKDSSIVLVGSSDSSTTNTQNYDVSIARLLPDGSLSSTFGLGGKVVVPFDLTPNGLDSAVSVVEQANGKLVVVGYSEYSSTPFAAKAIALRLNADGSLDSQFGSFGKFDFGLTSPSSQDFSGVALQGTQIIVSGGIAISSSSPEIDDFVARLNVDLIFADEF